MKRFLLLALTAGLAISSNAIADEETFKCLELGKQSCAYKLVAMGTCKQLYLQNIGVNKFLASEKAYAFYKSLAKQIGFFPTSEMRKGPPGNPGYLKTRSYVRAICPNELYNYAVSDIDNPSTSGIKMKTLKEHEAIVLIRQTGWFSLEGSEMEKYGL